MSTRESAIRFMKEENARHAIYGYRAAGKTVEGSGWRQETLVFFDDDEFVAYIDKMQAEIPGLEMVLAVHNF